MVKGTEERVFTDWLYKIGGEYGTQQIASFYFDDESNLISKIIPAYSNLTSFVAHVGWSQGIVKSELSQDGEEGMFVFGGPFLPRIDIQPKNIRIDDLPQKDWLSINIRGEDADFDFVKITKKDSETSENGCRHVEKIKMGTDSIPAPENLFSLLNSTIAQKEKADALNHKSLSDYLVWGNPSDDQRSINR